MNLGQFTKGFTPWNKGKPAPWAKNLPQQFKKGVKQKPETIDKISKTLKKIYKTKVAPFKGGHHSEETKRIIGLAQTGEKHWNYQGRGDIYSVDWTQSLKRAIRERDNYICQVCSQYGNEVHHIDYDKFNCNTDNLITLCKSCHTKTTHKMRRNYWINYFNGKK
ncbi:HNH endonuclease [Candidatus Dojkabacteria bacterium]|jgi:5-methylcytosine-specific restriction endonuclease McrA|nr:HNH endonuclease [Candidatus Dojkabacteria bacterium]